MSKILFPLIRLYRIIDEIASNVQSSLKDVSQRHRSRDSFAFVEIVSISVLLSYERSINQMNDVVEKTKRSVNSNFDHA